MGRRSPGRRGSSPLSRGIPARHPCRGDGLRIIPALAGNTRSHRVGWPIPTDHPRSRGEYPCLDLGVNLSSGSSPLSRGIRWLRSRGRFFVGIIPALAGNTSRSAVMVSRRRDHPRSRGEYPPITHPVRSRQGSSPLSRGIHYCSIYGDVRPGIIPALAGNTS